MMSHLLNRFFSVTIVVLVYATAALADNYSDYAYRGESFLLPGSTQGGLSVMDVLPNGRLIVVTTRSTDFNSGPAELYVETSAGSRNFDYLGDLDLPSTDSSWANPGAFVQVSPGGSKIAVGNNNKSIGIFNLSAIPSTVAPPATAADIDIAWYSFSGNSFLSSATWFDDQHIALNSAPFGGGATVTLLDTTSDPSMPTNPLIVSGPAAGASGAMAFDAAGNLYVGNGYDYAEMGHTGDIKKFDFDDWQDPAFSAGAALSFDSEGLLVGQILSANSLDFDSEGNLIVGGADYADGTPNKMNFLAVADFALDGTISGFRSVDPDSGNAFNSYTLVLNKATNEIYAFDPFGSNPMQVFVISVPEPTSAVLLCMAVTSLGLRRRAWWPASRKRRQ